jgi:hypothetical protein
MRHTVVTPQIERREYPAFGSLRSAEIRTPPRLEGQVVVILAGDAVFGIEVELPAARRLLEFGDELGEALLASGRPVIRPERFDAARNAEGCIEATRALLTMATETFPDLPLVVIGLSATAPLLAVAGSGLGAAAFILVSPPILETYGNRPERLELTIADALGVSPEIAAELGTKNPMQLGANVATRALVVNGAADTVVPPADAIGWRASLAAGGVMTARLEVAFAGHDLDPCRDTAIDGILSFLEDERR